MDLLDSFRQGVANFIPALGTLALVLVSLAVVRWLLQRRWNNKPDAQFRFQLIMLALSFAGILTFIISLPIDADTRGQLLSLIGILLSAAIALSSTTFIGNIMAGMMLKIVGSARPGDFITVADLTGRITEMGLLHTEIQTEFRDLVTVPNMYMVTHPTQLVRASGTIISAEVSLGYDVSHFDVAKILNEAATQSGLIDSFVHIRNLGDYAVSYRVAGLLEDVTGLISERSNLRESILDALHAAGIEIVSPSFMNTRAVAPQKQFIPEPSRKSRRRKRTSAEEVAFDKADRAASVEDIRRSIEKCDAELAAIEDEESDTAAAEKEQLTATRLQLIEELKAAEEERKASELAE